MKYLIGIALLVVSCFLIINDKQASIKIKVISDSALEEDINTAKDIYDAFVSIIEDDIYELDNIDDVRKYLIDSSNLYTDKIKNDYSNVSINLYCNNTLYSEYNYIDKKCDLNEIVISVGAAAGYTIASDIKVSEVIKSSEKIDVIKPLISR